jgi:hypothetical protein
VSRRIARAPSPLAGEGDRRRASAGDPGEASVSAKRTPHPTRTASATFSHKGRRKGGLVEPSAFQLDFKPPKPSLRGATRRSNPESFRVEESGLLRFACDDEGTHLRIPAARPASGCCFNRRPRELRGRRECRALAAPVSLACKGSALCARQAITGQPNIRHSLRSGLRLIRALLGVPCSLAAVALRYVPQALDPSLGGSGPHDFARPLRRRSSGSASSSTATRPTFRDDRPERPS